MDHLRGIDINLVIALDAVLTERSLTRAGESIGLTQSAVSGAVSKLRALIDDPLLVRNGRTFELTPRALELQPLVREAINEVSRTFNMRPLFDPLRSNRRFRVAASDYALSFMTAPLLSLLQEEAPDVTIDFSSLTRIDPVDLLRQDVVVASSDRKVPGRRQALFSDSYVCLVRRDHPLLVDGGLSIEDLSEMPYVEVFFAHNIVMEITDALSAAGIEPHVVVSVPGFLSVPWMIVDTDRFGFVPSRVAEIVAEPLGLVTAQTPIPHSTLVEVVYWHPSKSTDPALRWLVSMLRRTAERIEFAE